MNQPNNSDLRQRIREEVARATYKVFKGGADLSWDELEKIHDKATDLILSAFIESLPEKKYTPLDIGNKHPNKRAELMEFIIGYNQALADIKDILGGEK